MIATIEIDTGRERRMDVFIALIFSGARDEH
jgi:hypothetical protein